jgi:lysine 6-dehydrogenase
MGFRYLVLGAGRQGVAIAYDLALHGEATNILILDQNGEIARNGADRVNSLSGTKLVQSGALEVNETAALTEEMGKVDSCVSAVPYPLNLELTKTAIEQKTHFCDLGGNTGIVREQLAMSEEAKLAGISVVPDCGLAPGLGNSLVLYAIQKIEQMGSVAQDIKMYCGGLPRYPQGPLNYQLFFSVGGLINEYDEVVFSLSDGAMKELEPLTEIETLTFADPVGECEAFLTSGGTSLAPWNYRGKLNSYQYKTVRYPGHCEKIRAMRLLGLWESEKRQIDDVKVSPRAVFETMANEYLKSDKPEDVVVLRVVATGENHSLQIDLLDHFDHETKFTAMERTTGFATAIVAKMQASRAIKPGAHTPDPAVPATEFFEELIARGFDLTQTSGTV